MRNGCLLLSNFNLILALTFVYFFVSMNLSAQTTLIDPTGDGGFENGVTLASNGWIGVSSNQAWFVGTSSITSPSAGTNLAYTSVSSGSWTPGTQESVAHIFRDIYIPPGESILNVTLKYKTLAVDSIWDFLQVHVIPASIAPVSGTLLTFGQLGTNTSGTLSYAAYTLSGNVATGLQRLVISFKQDGYTPYGAAAIDEISVVSASPMPICNAQGTFTINNILPNNAGITGGNFSSFTNAINYINLQSNCGPLTLNVAAGQTFTENPPALTAIGTSSNPIIFQKSGSGINPVLVDIQGTSLYYDFGFCILGGDYITFDGIDVNSSSSTSINQNLEFGYLLINASSTNGAQNNTIKNCSVTLNKNFVLISDGGCIGSSVSTSRGGFTPVHATGANSNNKFYNLTLTNAQNGIYLSGDYLFPDLNNEIGVEGVGCQTTRNSISDVEGNIGFYGAHGIFVEEQRGIKIFNNDISNIRGVIDVTGIKLRSVDGINEIYNNKLSDISNSNSTTSTYKAVGLAISNSYSSCTVRFYNNIIFDVKSSYTGPATLARCAIGIYCYNSNSGINAEIDNNTIYLAVPSGTPTYSSSCFEIGSSSSIHKVRGNIFVNAFPTQGATAKHFCWFSAVQSSIGAAGSVSNYNDLVILNDQSTSGHIGRGGTTNYNTLANWQGIAPSTDINSVSVNPLFTSTSDFHVSNISLNAFPGFSTQTWVTTDIECVDRSTATPSDLGAYAIIACSVPDGGIISTPMANKCAGQTATMISTGASIGLGITYQWKVSSTSGSGYVNVTGGSGAKTTSYTTKALTAGTYYYVLETTCSIGPTTDLSNELTITFDTLPVVSVSPALGSICFQGGTPVSLTASGANTYTWSPAIGLSATTGSSVDASPTATTTYIVSGTLTATGCTNMASSTITVIPSVNISTSATPSTVCLGGNSQLLVLSAQSFTTPAASSYVFATTTGNTLQNMTGATNIVFSGQDFTSSAVTNIGFTFNYGGIDYTQFSASSNGAMGLGGTTVTNADANNSTTFPTILPAWDNMHTCQNGNVRYLLNSSGGFGHNILIVEWNYGNFSERNGDFTKKVQVWLYEGSNEIRFLYGAGTPSLANATVGIVTSSGNFNDVNTSSHTNNTAVAQDGNNSWPGLGRAYIFTPGGAPLFSYIWSESPGTTLSATNIYNPMANGITANSTYTVTVTGNSGCSSAASVAVNLASTATVTSTANAGAGSLRDAIACVANGGTVTTTMTSLITDPININKNVTIIGTSGGTIDFDFGATGLLNGSYGLQVAANKTLTLTNINIIDKNNPDAMTPSIKPVIQLETGLAPTGGKLKVTNATTITKQ